jgi:hypothetical protein
MKKKYSFLQINPFTRQTLLMIALAIFNSVAIAAHYISDDQIIRAARIAKATKTNITIVKETTTVTIHGGSIQTHKKVKKAVMKIMKQKSYISPQKRKSKNPPRLNSAAPDRPPAMEAPSDFHAPTLDPGDTGNSVYF